MFYIWAVSYSYLEIQLYLDKLLRHFSQTSIFDLKSVIFLRAFWAFFLLAGLETEIWAFRCSTEDHLWLTLQISDQNQQPVCGSSLVVDLRRREVVSQLNYWTQVKAAGTVFLFFSFTSSSSAPASFKQTSGDRKLNIWLKIFKCFVKIIEPWKNTTVGFTFTFSSFIRAGVAVTRFIEVCRKDTSRSDRNHTASWKQL